MRRNSHLLFFSAVPSFEIKSVCQVAQPPMSTIEEHVQRASWHTVGVTVYVSIPPCYLSVLQSCDHQGDSP